METGNKFYDKLPKNIKIDFEPLFQDKSSWYEEDEDGIQDWNNSWRKLGDFNRRLKAFATLQKDQDKYDFSYIHFPRVGLHHTFQDPLIINKKISFNNAIFYGETHFHDIVFNFDVDFYECNFKGIAHFEYGKFKKNVNFWFTSFEKLAQFRGTIFNGTASFSKTIFNGFADFMTATFKNAYFQKSIFKKEVDFNSAIFAGGINFEETIFEEKVKFYGNIFYKAVNFKKVSFNSADFRKVVFCGKANFQEFVFKDKVDFEETTFTDELLLLESDFTEQGYLNAKNMSFYLINLEGAFLESPFFLGMKGYNGNDEIKRYLTDKNTKEYHKKLRAYIESQKVPLDAQHFANKESARLIKYHLEQQNNITEANKYFRIEQEKYIEELKKEETKEHNKRATLFTLRLNKWVSDFGIDWPRALFSLFVFSYLAAIGYIVIANIYGWLPASNQDIIHHFSPNQYTFAVFMFLAWLNAYFATYQKDDRFNVWFLWIVFLLFTALAFYINWGNDRITTNYIVQLINPVNAFKEKNLYEGIEFYGMIVRVIALVIIYQIIVAFRQNTRRK